MSTRGITVNLLSNQLWNLAAVFILIIMIPTALTQICDPMDCIVGEWNNWSDCTETCGESGTRQRSRLLFREASCGGTCNTDTEETASCNIKCCPKDCVYTNWSKWLLCYCTDEGCEGAGERYNCRRMREMTEEAECGGYCDDVTAQQACGYLCCYMDCVLGSWSFWSICAGQCEQPGITKRRRIVTQAPHCGGKECGPQVEEKVCPGDCCPVHCKLGQWSTWSTCNTTCGESVETRSRFVQLPQCYGDECSEKPDASQTRPCSNYVNVDCEVSPWSSWTVCELYNGFCGEGSKRRFRTVATAQKCEGRPCKDLDETEVCYGPCCRKDCEIGEWSEWSHCSSSCGQGVSNRTRTIDTIPDCNGSPCHSKLLQSRDCVVTDVVDCEFTQWTLWTSCSTDCGFGSSVRTRILVTPAYCGGTCDNEATYEEIDCESYTATQDCEVSDWGDWGECIRNCDKGLQRRSRTQITNPICRGVQCLNLTETRTCHEACEQLCNSGTCSCKPGYTLNSDKTSCFEFSCPIPHVKYCPQTHLVLVDCRYPYFHCKNGYKYNKTCEAYCSPGDWKLEGSPKEVRCTEVGQWTQPELFCARPNKPPLAIEIDHTIIEENRPEDYCFAYLSTITDGEMYEKHTYSIIDDVTNRFYLRDNRLCLKRVSDYEEAPTTWPVTFRSSDLEHEHVDATFIFEVLNANDPPTGVKVEPNTIPENSKEGTIVGCLTGSDDDLNQTVSFQLVDTKQNLFTTYEDDSGKQCIKVSKESDLLCGTEGGTYCLLNKEKKATYYVTILATDDGSPPMSAYYDVPIKLSNINDRQTAVDVDPKMIPEEIEAGKSLMKLVTTDEDDDQTYTYTLLDDAGGLFRVNGDDLLATRLFNFEAELGAHFQIVVESSDDANPPLKVSSTINLQIEDINEKPYELQLSSVNGFYPFELNLPHIKENIKTAMLGTISVKDDDASDKVEIKFSKRGDGGGRLTLFNQRCSTLANVNAYCSASVILLGAFNYEKEQSVDVSIIATDTKGETVTLDLTMEILRANDPPSSLLINEEDTPFVDVKENLIDYTVAILRAIDEDIDDSHTYELSDSAGGTFVIQGNLLKTSQISNIDYERENKYNIKIKVTDDGDPRQHVEFDITVNVIDVNEGPTSTTLSNLKIQENSAEDTLVGELQTTDPDNLVRDIQSFRYTLPDDSRARFKLDGDKLLIRKTTQLCGSSICKLDYELEPKLYITVLTMDDGHPRLQRQDKFTIELENTNDPPTDIKLTSYTVNENDEAGSVVGDLNAYDQDGGQQITFRLLDHEDIFGLQDGKTLVTKQTLNYEMLKSYRVKIAADDNGSPPAQGKAELIIRVLNVNELPTLSNVTSPISIREDADVNIPLVTFGISDPDSRETISAQVTDTTKQFTFDNPICNTKPKTGTTDCTVNLILTSPLHVLVKKQFAITASVQDGNGLSSSFDMTINIEDINDPPTDILFDGIVVTSIRVKENSKGNDVASMTAVDRDVGQSYSFALHSDTNGFFEIIDNVLKTKASAAIDFESLVEDTITIVVNVTDSGTPPLWFQKSILVIVDDVNEKPVAVDLTSSSIDENSGEGTTVGIIQVTDPDNINSDAQSFTISLLDSAQGLFLVDGSVLKIASAGDGCSLKGGADCKLNYEVLSTYTLQLSVTDSGYPPLTEAFDVIVRVTNINDAPGNVKISGTKVQAGSIQGFQIGTLSVEDEDEGQSHLFTIIEDAGVFTVSDIGTVTVKNLGNLVEGDIVQLHVQAEDDGSPVLSTETKIDIAVIGDVSVDFTLTSEGIDADFDENSVIVNENINTGTNVATLVTTIPVVGEELTIYIAEGSDYFDIKNTICTDDDGESVCKAEVESNTGINYEEHSSIDVEIQALTSNGRTFSDRFIFVILNMNEKPTDIVFSSANITVKENSHDELLGQFHSEDPDFGDTHVFTKTDDGVFVLTRDGKLYTSPDAIIDFETTPSLTITIATEDAGGLSLEKEFIIEVKDVNEVPTRLILSNYNVNEMSTKGTHVGELSVDDPDNGQSMTFELLTSAGDRFAIEGSTLIVNDEGDTCKDRGGASCLLDYETATSYDIAIKVKDEGLPPLSAIFVVAVGVNDVNDRPRSVAISSTKVPEDAGLDTIVATLSTVDDDDAQSITYDVEPMDTFSIDGDKLMLAKSLDFESRPSFDVIINATDNGNPALSVTQVYVIDVINVNEPPLSITIISTTDSMTSFPEDQPALSENLPAATFIGKLVILDNDAADDISVQILTPALNVFNKECIPVAKGTRCTVDLRSGRKYDFETEPTVDFEIVAADKGGLQLHVHVQLLVKDANDPPTDIYLDGASDTKILVPENSQDVLLATLSVEDEEEGQSYTYTIMDSNKELYVVNNELRVTSAADINYEANIDIKLTIRATDNGTPPMYMDKEVTVAVKDVNEAPTDLLLTKNEIPETAAAGFLIGSFVVHDPDNANKNIQTFLFQLLGATDTMFRIEGSNLMVNNAEFDFETKSEYFIEVEVRDNGQPELSTAFKLQLNIVDMNDAPKQLDFSGINAAENIDIGSVIGDLSARDDDSNQHLVYSLVTNDVLSIHGNQVVVNGPINFEMNKELTIDVKVTDDGTPPLSLEKNFTIHVLDENEIPLSLDVTNNDDMTVSEATLISDTVATLEVIDQDLTERILIRITTGQEVFKLSPTGVLCKTEKKTIETLSDTPLTVTVCTVDLLLAVIQNYETIKGPVLVSVEAEDKGGLTLQRTWSFIITNDNEPPRDITLDTTVESIPENEAVFIVGTLSTLDEDDSDTHTYQIITYWDTFTINGDRLSVTAPLDYETQDTYVISIRSRDSGTPPMAFTKEFTLKVRNVNEAPDTITLSHHEVERTSSIGYIIGHVKVTDPDNADGVENIQKHSCSLSPPDLFSIDKVDLLVNATLPLGISGFEVTITCFDNGIPPLSRSQDFYINVVETVNAPKGIGFITVTGKTEIVVKENVDGETLGEFSIINLLTMAADDGSYLFMLENATLTTVSITGSTLHLVEALDFETTPSLAFVVRVMGVDSSGNIESLTKEFMISVQDVNEPPTGIGVYGGGVVTENSPAGTVIGDLFTEDPEDYETYTYTMIGVEYGLDATAVNTEMLQAVIIEGRTLKVGNDAKYLNHETSDVMTLLIQTLDSGEPPYSTTGLIHLRIDDVNDPPTDIAISDTLIKENSPIGAVIGYFEVEDEDKDQEQTCEILNMIDVPFKIIDNVYLAVASDVLDYENQKMYNVEVSCGDTIPDGIRLRYTKTITVDVTNVNEPPSNITLTSNKLSEENHIGQLIGEIKANDLDSPKIMYTIEESEDSSLFKIVGDSTLTADIVFDYESKQFFQVTIKASDDEGDYITKTFEIEILDINEAPSEIQLDKNTVSERAKPGDIVGRLTTLDVDRNQIFTYTLDANTTNLGSFDVKDSNLVVGRSGLDYERIHQHKVSVTSTDNGVPAASTRVDFTVEVTDSNEAPVEVIVGELTKLPEDTPAHTVITVILVDDPDENQKHSCQLSDMDPDLITINTKMNGEIDLVLMGTLNFEENRDIDVVIVCTDGEFDIIKKLTLTVVDVNEAPTSMKLSGSNTVLADAEDGYVIGDLTVTDEDAGQSHTYTILGPNSDIISVNEKDQLIMSARIPRQQFNKPDPSLHFTITVADSGDPFLTYNQTFVLPITNIELIADELPKITIDKASVDEAAEAGTVIGRLYTINNTISTSIHFSIVTNFENVFKVENNTYLVLERDLKDIDVASMQVTLKVEDSETFESATKTISIFIERSPTCASKEGMCGDEERCVTHNSSYSACECNSDFKRDEDKVCQVIDNCVTENGETELCQNGGTCVDGINSYVCSCQAGYKGKHCEINENIVTPCSSNPCKNNGVCIPDMDDDTYRCSCAAGWTASRCDVSVDDCENSVCHYSGTCVDKHLTYICACATGRKGLRCEYGTDVCSDKYCNTTHACVGLVLKSDTLCLLEKAYTVKLSYKLPVNTDIKTFQARLTHFIIKYGRFPSFAKSSSRTKRETESEDVQIYYLDAVEKENGNVVYSFVVLSDKEDPFMKEDVLKTLSTTCKNINSGELDEEVFCPAILEVAQKPIVAEPAASILPMIIGIVAGLLLVISLIVIIIVVVKKKNDNSVNPEGMAMENGSRRSSGYSSLSKRHRPLQHSPNRVGPEPPPKGDTPATSVSDMEAISY